MIVYLQCERNKGPMNTEQHHQATYNALNYFVHKIVSWCGIFHQDSGLAL